MSKKIRFHKRIVATGSLLTALFLFSANPTSAVAVRNDTYIQTLKNPALKGYIATSDAQISKISSKTGMSPEEVRVELLAGKLSPEALKEDGIDVSQLREVILA